MSTTQCAIGLTVSLASIVYSGFVDPSGIFAFGWFALLSGLGLLANLKGSRGISQSKD